ncbi:MULTISPECIES: TraR/DksA family transcriptional regulator [unclassified Neisseria]|uniref:TraR/DksA family transcriptional regulator n=1 Tax=unclassified Neisseria TaxID=2623750 RepID=UPI001071A395|nr:MULTISPECIES: TraR/DksA family transcriptional regulator [unclassified Neisseria]MBF0802940.1 TraR/DksA family transcriptional regulator [Neisseria sp. 19428wB4_WF04]TFU44469.1 TraR/DksA family transcriptional regulator [Neisseria sp. WF04]
MTDIIDQASENEALFLAEALSKHRPSENTGKSNYECDDCGDPIPEERRKAVPGCTRCVYCQEYFEHGYP